MASGGMPAFVWPVILFEILGGLVLIAGFQTRIVSVLLGTSCVATGLMYHFDSVDQAQMTSLLKN
ncbi:MAG: DoxX family membrane protein [Marinibacterium sp.]|nr:DoxX family membrane protein [Marinibacterium sp.]